MAQLGTRFKATEHDTTQNDYTPLPEMVADVEIIQSEIKGTDTKNGRGKMLMLRQSVVEPEDYKGRLVFSNITLEHDKADTQEIGQKTFAKLCRALELDEVEDSDELHFKTFRVKIGMGKPSKDKNPDGTPVYPAKNEIKTYYYPDEGNMPDVGVLGPVPAAANDNRKPANDNTPARGDARTTGNGGAAATGKARPWGRKAA
jgi:hypothetical protein